ncbi:hypothetical protein K7G68_08925 [Micrococcus luteus]|uniref:hypothetical protein n=1 Tax=Micrococcus luteus TaxID=1270 RepID=UPI001CA71B65|nr:hypothetical protein [Micrococcus luteus]QZY83675.1 hypothetical protein K7G68_08925 [Micrococcus luteus]
MTTRPRYTTAQLARFITLARGGRDRRAAALTAAMDRHPAGKHRTTPTPPLLNADGTPADTLPTTTPEDA